MTQQNRRTFLKHSAAAAGALAGFMISGTKASGRIIGANDTVRVCVCGIHGQGRSHINAYTDMKGAEVSHFVDPDSSLFEPRSKMITDKGGKTPICFQDIRKALEDDGFDAVSIASPNHWHSLLSILACEAGKDVYVEKPLSHNIFEGRKLVEAARRHNRIVQHGTQQRSSPERHKGIAAVASGKYGKLLISYGWASKPRGSIGFAQPEPPPDALDFDLWLGPAQKTPFHKNLVHYNWHWFWDFGNGEIGNQGVHQMDVARWVVTAATGLVGPKSVISMGGRYGYEDQGQTPNTQLTIMDFGETKLFFEDYGLVTNDTKKVDNEFYMEEGVIRGGKFYPKGKEEGEPIEDVEYTCYPGGNFGNFINCVRSRKQEELNADVLEGHFSAALCHVGNISYRLGEPAPFREKCDVLADDKDALEAFEGMKEHLKEHTKMDLNEGQYRLGRKLSYNAENEKFIGDEEANALLTRKYRAPFVVA
ncbi:MAG: Gfo/Idh/MocA family oxidoreductase [bacterium]